MARSLLTKLEMLSIQRSVTVDQRERSLLIVDDDETVRQGLGELLSDEGYYVLTAENGAEALVELRRHPRLVPRLILLDMTMPIMNGREFYDQKQQDPELVDIPVVVMSADRDLVQMAPYFGGAYLVKPARLVTILDMIARHLGANVNSRLV